MVKRCFVRIKKVCEFLLLLFFIAVVLLLLIPRMFHITQHVVLSGSMEPAIQTGSLCYLSHNVKADEIRKGQVIGYRRRDGSLVIHRVTRVEDGLFHTKGDANDREDFAPVQKEDYFGMVVYCVPYLGYLTIFLQNKKVLIVIGMLAAVFLMLAAFCDQKEGDQDEKI